MELRAHPHRSNYIRYRTLPLQYWVTGLRDLFVSSVLGLGMLPAFSIGLLRPLGMWLQAAFSIELLRPRDVAHG